MSSPILFRMPAIIQADFTALKNHFDAPQRSYQSQDQSQLIGLIVARIFILCVALGSVASLAKKFKLSTVLGIVLCHELFALAYNVSKRICAKSSDLGPFMLFVANIGTNLVSGVQGKGYVHELAEGTLLCPLWSRFALESELQNLSPVQHTLNH